MYGGGYLFPNTGGGLGSTVAVFDVCPTTNPGTAPEQSDEGGRRAAVWLVKWVAGSETRCSSGNSERRSNDGE